MRKLKIKSKSGLRVFTNEDIRSWGPCYDPKEKYSDETTRHTAVSILQDSRIPLADRLWVVLRTDLCSEKMMRLAAVWFYRDTLNWIKNPDPRSVEAANVAERFANGRATREELDAARSAAESAAWSAESAAESAAWSAAWSAAESVAYAAAYAVYAAVYAASAAQSVAEQRYANKLIEMFLAEGQERLEKKRGSK